MSIRFFIIWVLCGLLRPDAYTEEKAKKTSSTGSPTLVRDQAWPKEERHSDVELDLDNSEPTSFQRPTTPVASSYCLQNDSSYGSTRMEMWGLPNYESQEGGILPSLRRSLAYMLRGGQLMELVSEQCNAILTTTKKWKCEETVSKAICQRDIQRQGEGRQRKQGERQAISSSRRQSCFSLFGGGFVFTTAAIYSSLAGHGLLTISDCHVNDHHSRESGSNQSTRPRAYPGDQKSLPRGIGYASPGQGSTGESGGIRCKTNHQGPPCGNVRLRTSETCLPGSIGGPQAAQKWLDEALGGKSCRLGETIGHLPDKLRTAPGCRVQSPSRCCQCQAQHSAAELPVWEQRSRRSSVGRGNGGPEWRQGGGEGKATSSSSHAELHGLRWCRDETARDYGDPLRYRRRAKQTAKVSRSNIGEAYHVVIFGQTPPCQKKDGVNKANFAWFEDVEAYCHVSFDDSAASMPKSKVLTTAQACVHRHSVQDEPDFVSEYRSALNAFVLSWQVNVMSFGTDTGIAKTWPQADRNALALSPRRTKINAPAHHHRRIHFRKTVDLHIFKDQCTQPVPPILHGTDDLGAWNNKPWRLSSSHRQHGQAESCSQPHVSDLWCAASDSWPLAPRPR